MKPRKRAYRKKPMWKKSGQRSTLVNTSLRPIPARFITKSKYAEAVTVPATGMAVYRWRLNSLYDPNFSGVGHRPHGVASLSTLYNRYRVISCKYVISCISDDYNIQFAALPSNDTAALINNVSEARENPRCKYAVQNPGGTLKVLKGKVYIPALMGRNKSQYMADDNYQATFGANPAENAYLNIFAQGLNDDITTNVNATINVLLEYTYEAFDYITLDQS